MITSCLECRRRKLKCNKSHPCSNCTKFTRDCVFLAPALDQASQLKLTEIKEKVGSLERLLERDVAQRSNQHTMVNPGGSHHSLPPEEDDNLPGLEDEQGLEPTPLAVSDAAYDDKDGAEDELLDLGILMGKLRMTERIGGFFRPKMSEEVRMIISIALLLLPSHLFSSFSLLLLLLRHKMWTSYPTGIFAHLPSHPPLRLFSFILLPLFFLPPLLPIYREYVC
jgi:hypothetical protein